MTPIGLTEDNLAEQPALKGFRELGYKTAFGPDISPGGDSPERDSFDQVVLVSRLQKALSRLKPHLPTDALEDALRQLLHLDSPNLTENISGVRPRYSLLLAVINPYFQFLELPVGGV